MPDSAEAVKIKKVIVHSSDDAKTKKIPSVRGRVEKPKDHFVTPKGTGDVVLHAQVGPGTCDDISWEADGATITFPAVGTDKCTAKVARSESAKIDVRIKANGMLLWSGVVWVVWATVTPGSQTRTVQEESVTVKIDRRTTVTGMKLKMEEIEFTAQVTPTQIFSDKDRPELSGGGTKVPKSKELHIISNRPLSGGGLGSSKWDMSRQLRIRVLNPDLLTKKQLPPLAGRLYDNQPEAASTPETYPEGDNDMALTDPVGNDDASPEKWNRPYDAKSYGVLTSKDFPSFSMDDRFGVNGNTHEVRLHFREFVRAQIGDTWFRISDPQLWRVHIKFIKANGEWRRNGTGDDFALDNEDFEDMP